MADERHDSVLVVEDDAKLRLILVANLKAAGYDASEASDGYEAIDIATERTPDLIIMDLGLPGIDGIATTRTLKADPRTSAIPIIILTARSKPQDVVLGLEAGAQEYLAKPFDIAELMARVQSVHRTARSQKNLDQLNTQLEAEVDAKTRRLQLLYEFMREINLATSRDRILDLIVRCVEEMTAAQRISLLLRDVTGDTLVCERAVGIDPAVVDQIRVRTVEGIAGQVFRSGKTLSARAYGPDESTTYSSEAFLSTPLVTALETRDGIIGVLNLTNKTDNGAFNDEEIECIRSVADAGAIALASIEHRERLQQSVKVLLKTVGHLAEYRDEETTRHLERVTRMSRVLADALRQAGPYTEIITDEYVDLLVQAAPMHDIGKVGIPDEILTKPGALTDEEFNIMKTHTEIGKRVLSQALDPARPVPLLQMCIEIAHCHHEKFNGSGYPRQIAGHDIPLAARIIALVDAYDAITSQRRYKPALTHERAMEIITGDSGKHFDPALVEAFLRCQAQFDEIRGQYEETDINAEPALA